MTTVPPSDSSSDARAFVIAADPPSATGQPYLWPAAVSITATPAVDGRLSGRKMCAAEPANSARAWGS